MQKRVEAKVFDLPDLRNRGHVFKDREAAGLVLSRMLEQYRNSNAIVLAIPAGGVAVAAPLAGELVLPLDVAVVSKITLPWNTEAGYGAVAFDGTVRLNEELLSHFRLSEQQIRTGIRKAEEKVSRRVTLLRGDRPLPDFKRPILLVDDGLASGFTLLTAIEALRKQGCGELILAVPTAHEESLSRVKGEVGAVYCPNIRGGLCFAVADAYEQWRDLSEEEVVTLLKEPPRPVRSTLPPAS
jgi:predicted phosphoribosyltransferase